jgi:hypothetical protein
VKKLSRFFLLISLFITIVPPVSAAQSWNNCLETVTITVDNKPRTYNDVATIQCLIPLFSNLVTAVLQIAGIALFIMFVIAGFNFLLSGGDPKRLEQAKSTLTYAILGLVVIIVSYLIIQLISTITGVQGLNQFNIPVQ